MISDSKAVGVGEGVGGSVFLPVRKKKVPVKVIFRPFLNFSWEKWFFTPIFEVSQALYLYFFLGFETFFSVVKKWILLKFYHLGFKILFNWKISRTYFAFHGKFFKTFFDFFSATFFYGHFFRCFFTMCVFFFLQKKKTRKREGGGDW